MLRVLIAEDEDIIRKGLVYTTDWLSMDCVVVAEAANGQEGLEKILEARRGDRGYLHAVSGRDRDDQAGGGDGAF